jgi:hypothetical protein
MGAGWVPQHASVHVGAAHTVPVAGQPVSVVHAIVAHPELPPVPLAWELLACALLLCELLAVPLLLPPAPAPDALDPWQAQTLAITAAPAMPAAAGTHPEATLILP